MYIHAYAKAHVHVHMYIVYSKTYRVEIWWVLFRARGGDLKLLYERSRVIKPVFSNTLGGN